MESKREVDLQGNCSKCGGVHFGTGPDCVYGKPVQNSTIPIPPTLRTGREQPQEEVTREFDPLARYPKCLRCGHYPWKFGTFPATPDSCGFHQCGCKHECHVQTEGGEKPRYDARLVVQMKGVEVVHEAAIQMSIDSYNRLQTNLDECQRQLLFVDYMAESVRVMSEECFVALCRQICKGCDEKPSYGAYYLGWMHGQYRCNASILHTLRSGRTFLPSSLCVNSDGGERWYKTATEESIRKADEYEKHQH